MQIISIGTWIVGTFVSFVAWDIYLKPLVQRSIKLRLDPWINPIKDSLDPYLATIFDAIDFDMPNWLLLLDGDTLKSKVSQIIDSRTNIAFKDDEQKEQAVNYILEKYNPAVNADKIYRSATSPRKNQEEEDIDDIGELFE